MDWGNASLLTNGKALCDFSALQMVPDWIFQIFLVEVDSGRQVFILRNRGIVRAGKFFSFTILTLITYIWADR